MLGPIIKQSAFDLGKRFSIMLRMLLEIPRVPIGLRL